jgi:chemotaxis protein CheD
MKKSKTFLKTGERAVAGPTMVLATAGIGSCIVICLWDQVRRVGGMAHIPFPEDESRGTDFFRNPGLSPDTAVPCILNLMLKRGSLIKDIVAKIAGAGNMFAKMEVGPMIDLVKSILDNAHAALAAHGLPLIGHSVGGVLGRSLTFDTDSGLVEVKFTDGSILAI